MAKGFERREYRGQQGMQYGNHPDAVTLAKLGEVVSDLYMCTDEKDRPRLWSSASRLLARTKADKERVAKIMQEKRVGALSKLVADMQQEFNAPKVGRAALAAQSSRATVTPVPPGAESDAVSTDPTAEQPPPPPPEATPGATPAAGEPSASSDRSLDELKQALKAFRKRLKLTKLDEESRLGNRAMSAGRKSAVVAITPPREYPQRVWDELVRQGKLKPAGSGFLELVDGA